MRSSSIILTALAAVASAYQVPNRAPQALAAASAAIRERRDLDACNSVATAVIPRITDAPTAPADVAAYLAISATITDACVDPTITGSVGSAYSTFASELTSWREKHMSDFRAVWQACSDVPGVVNVLPTGSGQCSSLVAQITSAGPVNNGGSGGGGGSGSGNGGGVGNAARPRETGAVVAVVAVAGFVVAALQ
ncbi:Infection structure specific protein [Colletotrichum higginsianum IMI 349063]|uniref:Infection structure specific protein n=1 Tax=Colletotrichum higginsianum (strain IMI 349063) TaxID=759273 RepID=A0A1B7XXW5_COLHI|nr:Infection structure specific protein [Colletotrichum higginsianum IMI 349063]OBR04617.1 Infection structure specific protein [Colletotrichum higginsianum IMI 349063]GJC99250.1 infection structure specific protein [Colletotrichum higginsianum]